MPDHYTMRRLSADDLDAMDSLLHVLGEVFDEPETYVGKRPSPAYLSGLLGSDHFIVVVAETAGSVVGGIAAYELKKFEQERSEIYLYDLAVIEEHRRRGVATGLIRELKRIAAASGAYVIFVQADTGPEDEAAIALYSKLGTREDVLHFDISVEGGGA
jgi:aminoglycoside 3-N-acetyltransferase I